MSAISIHLDTELENISFYKVVDLCLIFTSELESLKSEVRGESYGENTIAALKSKKMVQCSHCGAQAPLYHA